jgi:hypothetical protein
VQESMTSCTYDMFIYDNISLVAVRAACLPPDAGFKDRHVQYSLF